jgi:hypothetical protein
MNGLYEARRISAPQPRDDRAGIALRLWGVILSLFGVALGLCGLLLVPEQCRLIGCVAAGLFIPAGGWLLFASLRGRQSDLQDLSASKMADTGATDIVGQVLGRVIDDVA